MHETAVNVWGKPVEVSVYQKSKSVWIAVGTYMGGHLEVKGSSRTSALSHWRKAAEYKGG